jgi:NTP pyrophosphatase (non-canonical NTP hydrolase)
MERLLRYNEHKGHWGNLSLRYLMRRAQEELDEAKEALQKYSRTSHKHRDPSKLIDECADVANIVMMIADNARAAEERVTKSEGR